MGQNAIVVRGVRESDLPALIEIDQRRWEREGVGGFSPEIFEQWFASRSPFFIVATQGEAPVGYYHAIQVDFSLDNIEEFTAPDVQNNQGYTTHAHDPAGRSVYAASVATITKDAGTALNVEFHRRLRELHIQYYIGVSRLPGLIWYFKKVKKAFGGSLPHAEKLIVLWYAHESMKMIKSHTTWPECTEQPALDLPRLSRPDPIMAYHATWIRAGLLRIIPNYMPDPKSLNYGAFMAAEHFEL